MLPRSFQLLRYYSTGVLILSVAETMHTFPSWLSNSTLFSATLFPAHFLHFSYFSTPFNFFFFLLFHLWLLVVVGLSSFLHIQLSQPQKTDVQPLCRVRIPRYSGSGSKPAKQLSEGLQVCLQVEQLNVIGPLSKPGYITDDISTLEPKMFWLWPPV